MTSLANISISDINRKKRRASKVASQFRSSAMDNFRLLFSQIWSVFCFLVFINKALVLGTALKTEEHMVIRS